MSCLELISCLLISPVSTALFGHINRTEYILKVLLYYITLFTSYLATLTFFYLIHVDTVLFVFPDIKGHC